MRKQVFRGDRLKVIRETRNLTQDDVAQRTEMTNVQVYRYETGKAEPSPEVMVRLALALEVTTDYLLGLVDRPNDYLTPKDLTPDELRLLSAFRRKDAVDGMRVFANHLATES